MANDPSAAQAPEPAAPSEEDYQAFLAALSGSARGRAFLAEHARRSRGDDTAMLLSAMQRLEGLVASQAPLPADNPGEELRGMLEAIRGVQEKLDVTTLSMQVANLAALIEGVQQRIETMLVPPAAVSGALASIDEIAVAPEPVAIEAEAQLAGSEIADPAPEAEAPVETIGAPQFEDAELPLPETVTAESAEPPVAETTHTPAVMPEDAWPAIPEVAWCDSDTSANETPASADSATPPAGLAIAALVETLVVPSTDDATAAPEAKVIKAGSIPPPAPYAGEDFSAAAPPRLMPPPIDPLADIKALSDEERVALFT